MNIAIISGTFLPQINGVLSYVLDTATELAHRGHSVTVFAPAPPKNTPYNTSGYPFSIMLLPSISAVVYPDLRITKPTLYQFTKILKERSIDIVHINEPYPIAIEAMIAAKLLKIPVVLTFHTFYLDKDFLKHFRFNTMIEFLKSPLTKLNINFHNYADLVICPSISGQKELISHGLTSPSIIIHNGINDDLIRKDTAKTRQKMRKRFSIDVSSSVGMFVGRLSLEKSIDVLIRSWSIVNQKHPTARLVIVGYGPMEQSLRQLTKKLKLTSSIIFAGRILRSELLTQGVYTAADIYVSASRIENQSMSMIEAMAYGLPIVATNKRGVSELVDDTNGIPVSSGYRPLARGILTLFEDETCRKGMSLASTLKSKQHFTSHTIEVLEHAYQQLIHK